MSPAHREFSERTEPRQEPSKNRSTCLFNIAAWKMPLTFLSYVHYIILAFGTLLDLKSAADIPGRIRPDNNVNGSILSPPESRQSFSSRNHLYPSLNANEPRCDPSFYGSDLKRTSCFNAWQNIGFGDALLVWFLRTPNEVSGLKVPFRWSSGRFLTRIFHQAVTVLETFVLVQSDADAFWRGSR
ncbi:hypothetical protein ACLMJK_007048 [Lecanora helva]